jgi:hypothetical protein
MRFVKEVVADQPVASSGIKKSKKGRKANSTFPGVLPGFGFFPLISSGLTLMV